jgi:hypothetical protein
MPPRTGIKNLTDFERGQIIGLRRADATFRLISTIVEHSQSTCKEVYYRWKRDGTLKTKQSGRIPILSERDSRRLIREAKANRKQPLQDITNFVASQVSTRTVRRVLAKAHIKKWIAAERPELTENHARQRLEWALEHKDWTSEQWSKVVWSDECSVEKSKDPRQVWVFKTPGKKWLKDCINPKLKSGLVKLMVWGCFAGKRKGTFAIVQKE